MTDYCDYGGVLPHPDYVLACGCVRCRSHCKASESCPEGRELWRAYQAFFVGQPGDTFYDDRTPVSSAEYDRRRDAFFAHFGR